MEISVIIPVYNAEKYLNRCVESVLAALGKIKGEILLVDNGSTDNSLKIAKNFHKKLSDTVRVLQCDTRGASAARNLGVANAKGKYLWFVDADDYIAKDAISKLVAEAEAKKADLVMLGAKNFTRGGESYLAAINTSDQDYKSKFVRYGMGPWQVLIRRSWWLEHNFRFYEGIIHEDMELMSALILYTEKFASVDEPLYFYCNNPESVLHKTKWDPKYFDIFVALTGLYDRFKKANAEKEYHKELEWFFIWNLLLDSAKDFKNFPEGRSGLKSARKMMKKYFPKWYRNRFFRQKPIKLKLRIVLNYFGL